jgi:predicted NAD/FAD-binding protein
MRIAVVGTGIAGLGAAYALSRAHDVEVFEREERLGGHTHTVLHRTADGRTIPLDTGFIVMNERNYPRLTRLFAELGVRTQDSEMSFSVSCRRCGVEWSGRRPLAQPRNAARPAFLRMLRDVRRWLRRARVEVSEDETLGQHADRLGYSREFRDHFLVPLTAAIWSTAPGEALGFPAAYAVEFFDNHGMLGFGRFRWKTVSGGSRTYVEAIAGRLRPDRIRLGSEVRTVRRRADEVTVETSSGESRRFDGIVVATHPDQALGLLADPSDDERRVLGAFRYTANETVLHTDERLLPERRSARASWNYQLADCRSAGERPTMTYYLNRLQALDEPAHYCVTLNRGGAIDERAVIARMVYEHPQYSFESLRAQRDLPSLNGARRTAFCGAYHGFGFHEDGLASGLRAAAAFEARG